MRFRDRLSSSSRLFQPDAPPGTVAAPVEPTVVPPAQATTPSPAPTVAAPEQALAPAQAPPTKDWKDARIAELTAKLNEAKRAVAAVPAGGAAPAQQPGETQAQFEARVAQAAQEIFQVSTWNQQCNAVAEQGRKEFTDFNDRLAACHTVVNKEDPAEVQQFNEVLAAAVETGQAHKLIHQLGENPGELKKLMGLPPMKRAIDIAQRAVKLGVPPADPDPSGAPRPITPIGSSGVHYDGVKPDDPVNGGRLPTKIWMQLREKQAQERGLQ